MIAPWRMGAIALLIVSSMLVSIAVRQHNELARLRAFRVEACHPAYRDVARLCAETP